MPLWLEVLVLVQVGYGLGFGLGWLVWARNAEHNNSGRGEGQ